MRYPETQASKFVVSVSYYLKEKNFYTIYVFSSNLMFKFTNIYRVILHNHFSLRSFQTAELFLVLNVDISVLKGSTCLLKEVFSYHLCITKIPRGSLIA